MHQRLLPTTLVFAVTAALALTGCSLGGGDAPGERDATKTPMTEYYEAIYGNFDEKDAIAQQKKSEELVAVCMADEGFDYQPVDQSQGMVFSSDDEDRDTEEWVAEHGYGMNPTPEEQAEQNEQSEEFVDPNQEYVAALSESEQMAYYEVLYGPGPSEEDQAAMDAGEPMEYDWETAGCQGAAQHEVSGEDITQSDEHKPLMDDLNAMWETQQSDPAIVKLDSEWAACMADAGFADFTSKQDAMNEVSEAQNAYWEDATENTEPPSEELQAEWRDHEIEVALADFRCAEKVDYQDRALDAQIELEERFIADHKSELDALVADVAQSK